MNRPRRGFFLASMLLGVLIGIGVSVGLQRVADARHRLH